MTAEEWFKERLRGTGYYKNGDGIKEWEDLAQFNVHIVIDVLEQYGKEQFEAGAKAQNDADFKELFTQLGATIKLPLVTQEEDVDKNS